MEEFEIRLEIINEKKFKGAIKFAKGLGGKAKNSFKKGLRSINRIKRNYKNIYNKIQVAPDFVEHSFTFTFSHHEHKKMLVVGLIFHGSKESFSTELGPPKEPHWSVHT